MQFLYVAKLILAVLLLLSLSLFNLLKKNYAKHDRDLQTYLSEKSIWHSSLCLLRVAVPKLNNVIDLTPFFYRNITALHIV